MKGSTRGLRQMIAPPLPPPCLDPPPRPPPNVPHPYLPALPMPPFISYRGYLYSRWVTDAYYSCADETLIFFAHASVVHTLHVQDTRHAHCAPALAARLSRPLLPPLPAPPPACDPFSKCLLVPSPPPPPASPYPSTPLPKSHSIPPDPLLCFPPSLRLLSSFVSLFLSSSAAAFRPRSSHCPDSRLTSIASPITLLMSLSGLDSTHLLPSLSRFGCIPRP